MRECAKVVSFELAYGWGIRTKIMAPSSLPISGKILAMVSNKAASDIVGKLWNLCNVLKDD